jgi:hypothetical protein
MTMARTIKLQLQLRVALARNINYNRNLRSKLKHNLIYDCKLQRETFIVRAAGVCVYHFHPSLILGGKPGYQSGASHEILL